MLQVEISEGALFYGKNRRRQQVCFDDKLRVLTIQTSERLHRLIESQYTPSEYSTKCDSCSLMGLCMPRVASFLKSVEDYFKLVQR